MKKKTLYFSLLSLISFSVLPASLPPNVLEDKTYILLRTLDELNSEYVLLRWSVNNNNNEINDKSEKYKVF